MAQIRTKLKSEETANFRQIKCIQKRRKWLRGRLLAHERSTEVCKCHLYQCCTWLWWHVFVSCIANRDTLDCLAGIVMTFVLWVEGSLVLFLKASILRNTVDVGEWVTSGLPWLPLFLGCVLCARFALIQFVYCGRYCHRLVCSLWGARSSRNSFHDFGSLYLTWVRGWGWRNSWASSK